MFAAKNLGGQRETYFFLLYRWKEGWVGGWMDGGEGERRRGGWLEGEGGGACTDGWHLP